MMLKKSKAKNQIKFLDQLSFQLIFLFKIIYVCQGSILQLVNFGKAKSKQLCKILLLPQGTLNRVSQANFDSGKFGRFCFQLITQFLNNIGMLQKRDIRKFMFFFGFCMVIFLTQCPNSKQNYNTLPKLAYDTLHTHERTIFFYFCVISFLRAI